MAFVHQRRAPRLLHTRRMSRSSRFGGLFGATDDRPGNTGAVSWPPAVMYDTTLSKVIFLVPNSNPAAWIDISGSSV
jgi:hypothetical protein